MTAETRFHKHWTVKISRESRLYRLLKIRLATSTDRAYVERSRLVWGQPDTRKNEFILTVLGLLHGFTGLTLEIKPETPRCEECGDRHPADLRHEWTDGT